MGKPILQLDKHQQAAFWSLQRTLFLLWRRQAGKSFDLAAWSLDRMMARPNHLITFASASVSLGKELALKEALVWTLVIQTYRDLLSHNPTHLVKTSADDDNGNLLDADAIADLFEHNRLETRIYHSNSVYSRTVVIAPNPDTAVGWTGDIVLDEVGRIRDLKAILEAVEPIMIRNPEFMMRLATTISPDDAHPSRDLHAEPPEKKFTPNPKGNFYTSRTGYLVHRFDAWDAEKGGLKLYDAKTGEAVSPEEHRSRALDRPAWDRNYGLISTSGGTAALSITVLSRAQTQGIGQAIAVDHKDALRPENATNILPRGWTDLVDPAHPRLGLGYDIATTTGKKSNPSSIALVQELGLHTICRLLLRFKSDDERTARRLIEAILDLMPHGLRIRRLCIDATSERYSAGGTRRLFLGRLPVDLIIASETTEFQGQRINNKALLGNRLINAIQDGYHSLPPDEWVQKDFRLVRNEKGILNAEVDSEGNHADTFDADKLALHALASGSGPAEAHAHGPVAKSQPRAGIKNPLVLRKRPTLSYR